MNKKYILTGETRLFAEKTLHRIQAIKDFGNVYAGDLGGWVEGEHNLSHNGTCWIYDDAKVKDAAFVFKGAVVRDSAIVQNYATIGGDAIISEHATVSDTARIKGKAQIGNYSWICDCAEIFSNAIVKGYIKIGKHVKIGKNAHIASKNDYFCIDNIGSRDDTVIFYVDKNRNIYANTGCFNNTLKAFEKAIERTHEDNKFAKQYRLAIQLAEEKLR